VSFSSGLAAAPFRMTSLFVLLFVVTPHIGQPMIYLKYCYAGGLLLGFVLLALSASGINLRPRFPVAALVLSMLGCFSLAYSTLAAPGTNTYASALIPLLLVAMPLLIGKNAAAADSTEVARYLFAIFSIGALVYVAWQGVGRFLGWDEGIDYYGWMEFPWLTGTTPLVFLMLLSGLLRRPLLLLSSVGLVALSLMLRPTSTLAFGAGFALAFVFCYRLRLAWLLRYACAVGTAAILLANIAVLESGDLAAALYSVEPGVKHDLLHGGDNNEFRLGVIAAARDLTAHHSLLFGEAFTGDATVDASPYLPFLLWEGGTGIEPIHCDYITMIVEGGLLGYALFSSLFVGMALLCATGARLARAALDRTGEILFDAVQAANIVFMLYISGSPTLSDLQDSLPYLMLIPVAIFLTRSQLGFFTRCHMLNRPTPIVPFNWTLQGPKEPGHG
jgi:hypothetical protein